MSIKENRRGAILSLLTFFLIVEKESKMGFPAFPPKSSKLFLLPGQKKVNSGFTTAFPVKSRKLLK